MHPISTGGFILEARSASSTVEEFAQQTIGVGVGICASGRELDRDGLRLGRLDRPCRTVYIGFAVALDWARFQATLDAQLDHLARDLLSLPAVQWAVELAAAPMVG